MSVPTPARQQYLDVKARHPHDIVWFRLGDFYEMFDDDAHAASTALRITLTSRTFGKDCRVPMCGVPHHAYARFLSRLVRQGFSVAICEQVSQPGRGLVEREVVRVVTPGTISEPELLRSGENNYLAAIARRGGALALAYVDVSTGEFRLTEPPGEPLLLDELQALNAAECLVEDQPAWPELPVQHVTSLEPANWDPAGCHERLRRQFGLAALHVAGCEGRPAALAAAGAILAYLLRTNRSLLKVIHTLRPYAAADTLEIDPPTRALLLGRPGTGSGRGTGLAAHMDRTTTPMGARLLVRWLQRPLRVADVLNARLDAVGQLLADPSTRGGLRVALRAVSDLERLTARAAQERATAEEMIELARTLEAVPAVCRQLPTRGAALLHGAASEIDPALDIAAAIRGAVAEPGGERLIRPGHDPLIDRLGRQAEEAREQLATLEREERARTGIRSLKVAYNQVVGYYIEVTKANLARVPDGYVRKQTLAHAERFVCPALVHWEAVLADAEAALQAADRSRYLELQQGIALEAPRLQRTASALALVDVLAGLAELAEIQGYTRPDLADSTDLEIEAGRHPLVEPALERGAFIPNDCRLGGDGPALAVITGPNMGGKSTYLRQIALIVFMAQIGSFVPARRARIGLADRIFARIGAHDDISAGQSTFLVEMAQTAAIVRLATPRSLVLLDEIGRGTTSVDGMAIARAVAEHMHEVVGARTLFATHYYDLAQAAEAWPAAINMHVRAEEEDGEVTFLYRVERGSADRSFALHVARMAGMPEAITARAEDLIAGAIADRRPGTEHTVTAQPAPIERQQGPVSQRPALRLAETPRTDLVEQLLAIDLASMTPIEALNSLYALQQLARATEGCAAERASPQRGYPA